MIRHVLATSLALMAAATPSSAQDRYPSRFVKVITTTGTGTGPDVVLRVVMDQLGKE